MRLLFYIHGITGGGSERVLSEIVNRLANEGNEVHLATRTEFTYMFDIDSKVIQHNLYENYDYTSNRLLKAVILRCNIRRIAKAVAPDVIIAFMAALGCSVIFSTLGLGIPVIVSEHTNVNRNLGHALNIKRRLLYPFASAVTVLTRNDIKLWKKIYANAVYMPNPIDLSVLNRTNNIRRKVVLAVGRVSEWRVKGFDNLIKCWSRLCHRFPDWKLEIAGDYDEASKLYLDELAKEYDCIHYEFLGFRRDIDILMMNSEVFCLSSRIEGLPMALIEAMHYGCCCVSFDVTTGPREIICDKKSGLLAADQDNDDLTAQLQSVLENDSLRESLAHNAHESVKKYSISYVIMRWKILLEKVSRK